MVKLIRDGVIWKKRALAPPDGADVKKARTGTMAYKILAAHNTSGNMEQLKIKFDGLASHDITYVGIIQTARASGLASFPLPYVLTNCHNSLCAVGGTINEDDHAFGLTAAQKYGGIYVPAHQAVIHQYMRERMAGCGKMLLGSDSHTRYGALGTMAVGEGGGELAKQLLGHTYNVAAPKVVAVVLEGEPQPGVGPQDVALALIGAVFENGFVKNSVLEFIGGGIAGLSADYRNGIDVMTTETTCLSSIWETDEVIREYYEIHRRPEQYRKLQPDEGAYYDRAVEIDLSKIQPMIALPFHPSNTYTIAELNKNPAEILAECEKKADEQLEGRQKLRLTDKIRGGALYVDQGIIAGCAGGTFENIVNAASILGDGTPGSGQFSLSVYPASQPVYLDLLNKGAAAQLMRAGVNLKTAFCGPCFGAGDVPANNDLSVRHTTRNFPNREGSKPSGGQIASVALMDARSIAATAANGGRLTPATVVMQRELRPAYYFDGKIYENRVYNGMGAPKPEVELRIGPGIVDWPKMDALPENLLLYIASVINDPVTTTDELIPSGETSSYRSNPHRLAEFTLSRKDPGYVERAKQIRSENERRKQGTLSEEDAAILKHFGASSDNMAIGSVIFARKPGDGSAREQAASCQKVLGGWANIALEYATKRYRSNLVNWGMLPFVLPDEKYAFKVGDKIFIPDVREKLRRGDESFRAAVYSGDSVTEIELLLPGMTEDERGIVLAGCLINAKK